MARNLAFICVITLLGFAAAARPSSAAELQCLTCHSAPGFQMTAPNGESKSLHVDQAELSQSAHAKRKCLDCHVDFVGQKLPHKQVAQPVQCARCHHNGNKVGAPDVSHIDRYTDSVHGNALKNGLPDAPQCKTCHGTHGIKHKNDPRSSVYRTNIPGTCGKCHFDSAFAKRHNVKSVKGYTDSVHATLEIRKDGFRAAAVCIDCHGVHDIKAQKSANSSVNRLSVADTCGKCHASERNQYLNSIHGKAVQKGVTKAPVCTDCHGEHLIMSRKEPDSPVNPAHIVATCSKCHENKAIQSQYGLPANRLSSYISSYHGVANKYGDVTVANCATCHSAHNVLPSSDPKSDINKKNLPQTCGKCHPGAGKNFAVGSIHVVPSPKHDRIVFWVRAFYLLFVVGIIGSFCGYILLDLRARLIGRLPWRGHKD